MEHKTVKSSTIQSIGYDAKEKILEVLFNSGGLYRYSGVSKEVADAFLNSDSKGSYFAISIRACFPCTRMHTPECKHRYPYGEPDCSCWCHKQRKDVSHGAQVPNPSLAKDLKKSITQSKSVQKRKAAQAKRVS